MKRAILLFLISASLLLSGCGDLDAPDKSVYPYRIRSGGHTIFCKEFNASTGTGYDCLNVSIFPNGHYTEYHLSDNDSWQKR